MRNLMALMKKGGAVMWPLFALLVLALVLVVERTITFALAARHGEQFKERAAFGPLSLLDLVASIAPVLGFLGTVTGMISAFRAISQAETVKLQVVASGLYEALYTTAFGLIISVIAAAASHVLGLWADSLCDESTKR